MKSNEWSVELVDSANRRLQPLGLSVVHPAEVLVRFCCELFFLVFKVGVTDLHETDPNCTDQILAPDRSDYPDYHFRDFRLAQRNVG